MKRVLLITIWIFSICFVAADALAEETIGRKLELREGLTMTIDAFHRTKEGTVLLKFTIQNDSHSPIASRDLLGSTSMGAVKLVHLAGRKVYHCMQYQYNCYGSRWDGNEKILPTASRQYWSHFTAPPGNVNVVSLGISDHPPFNGLTIGSIPE